MRKSSLGFEILTQHVASPPHSTQSTGVRTVRCPKCGKVFDQVGSGGCFTMLWTPMNCISGCGFPWPEFRVSEEKGDNKDET